MSVGHDDTTRQRQSARIRAAWFKTNRAIGTHTENPAINVNVLIASASVTLRGASDRTAIAGRLRSLCGFRADGRFKSGYTIFFFSKRPRPPMRTPPSG
jgi:hypothetical protein